MHEASEPFLSLCLYALGVHGTWLSLDPSLLESTPSYFFSSVYRTRHRVQYVTAEVTHSPHRSCHQFPPAQPVCHAPKRVSCINMFREKQKKKNSKIASSPYKATGRLLPPPKYESPSSRSGRLAVCARCYASDNAPRTPSQMPCPVPAGILRLDYPSAPFLYPPPPPPTATDMPRPNRRRVRSETGQRAAGADHRSRLSRRLCLMSLRGVSPRRSGRGRPRGSRSRVSRAAGSRCCDGGCGGGAAASAPR